MANFDLSNGVLDSWDLLYPVLDRYVDRNKESVQVGNLKLFSSSSSLLLKKTSFTPVFNSISAGYYPVFGGLYKSYPSSHDRPLIQVTVCPKSAIPVANTHKRPKRQKKTPEKSDHSIDTKKTYITIPGNKKEKVYVIDPADAEIYKEINDNKLLSECMIKTYLNDMNKTRKKISDKTKEKDPLLTIPECSPDCAFMNTKNKIKNASPDRSGPPSPQSPVRSSYTTKAETMIKKQTTVSKQATTSQRHSSKSPDRNSLRNDDTKTKSPTRSSQQKTRISIHQSEKNQKAETPKSPDKNSMRSKRSIESIIAEQMRRPPERYEKIDIDTGRAGRIRITGRLGLTEDDKCVLKCDATLNDQPIPTQFQGVNCALLPPCYQACNEEYRSSKMQRDAKVQAKESPIANRFFSRASIGKESQATQVDFQMIMSTSTNKRDDFGRGKVKHQCACINTFDNAVIYDNKEDTGTAIKKNHSPLIVISVYSNSKNDDPNEKSSDLKSKQTKSTDKKDSKKTGRSRSPSPAKNNKKVVDKKSGSHVNESTSKKTVRETARKVTKTKLSQTQSRSMVRSNSAKTKTESKMKSKSSKAQNSPPQSRRSNSPHIKPDEGNITEQMKRALIDDFTKNYTEHINQRNAQIDIPLQTKHNVSNITIDIEGDSEYYNVKLKQNAGKLNTELTVRKPPRGPRPGDITASTLGETDTTSLENFLYMPENEPRRRSFSQTLMYDGTDFAMNNKDEDGNALNVKDSIELSHRRETKASVNDSFEKNDIPKEVDNKYSDRVSRDKEIKKLLGIDKGVKSRNKPSTSSTVVEKNNDTRSIDEASSNNAVMTEKTEMDTKNWTTDSSYDVFNTVVLHRPLQQKTWNKNIQLFYHSSFCRPKPIVLTRCQYNKIKRTIICNSLFHTSYIARSDSNNRRFPEQKIKLVETNIPNNILHYDKDSQTENSNIIQIFAKKSYEDKASTKETVLTDVGNTSNGSKVCSNPATFDTSSNDKSLQQVIQVNNYAHAVNEVFMSRGHSKHRYKQIKQDHLMKVASVKDIEYRRMAINKPRVKFSSSDSANYISRTDTEKQKSYSIHTLFKCHQKSVTPNLGISANSLCNSSENIGSRLKFFEESMSDERPKKPFLKRLISCLVFNLSPTSQTKNPRGVIENRTPASSLDSYHISTSLGAIEMSSSLYDTSASFYSDHAMQGVKRKRGFLSSVRGLLARKN